MANYGNIKYCDIANGIGIRTSVFISGCTHHCKNCFNPETWDFNYGELLTPNVITKIIDSADPDYIDGITLLGGDPLCGRNAESALELCIEFKKRFPNKTIWLWTGYTLEEIQNSYNKNILKYIDVLIDGPFVEEEYEYGLQWRGSRNQRILKKGIDF